MIKLVQQPTGDTCTSACLAMLTGIDVNDVVEKFHGKWKENQSNPSEFLDMHCIEHEVNADVFDHRLEWGMVYLVTVPSLNIDGGLHHIILDLSGDKEVVLDPNNGKDGKRYYVGWSNKNLSESQVKVNSWMIDIKINPNDAHES